MNSLHTIKIQQYTSEETNLTYRLLNQYYDRFLLSISHISSVVVPR